MIFDFNIANADVAKDKILLRIIRHQSHSLLLELESLSDILVEEGRTTKQHA